MTAGARGLVGRGRRWSLGGLALGLVAFLVLGLVFGPLVNARVSADEDVAGILGLDAGVATPFCLVAASLAFGFTVARVYGLVRSAEWWRADAGDGSASAERREVLG